MFRHFITASVVLSIFLIAHTARAQFNPLSIIKGAVEAAVEERSGNDIKKDLEIKAKITSDVIDKLGSQVISINADVYEQDVMLTGSVETADIKKKAFVLARKVKGVKRIHNDILVIKDIDKKKGAAENFVDDTVIENKINALLLDGQGVNVTNFRWRAVRGNVFLFGRALSKAELNKAVGIVKAIKGVKKLTNRVKVVPK